MSEAPEIARPPGRPLPRIALGCGNFGGVGSAPEFFGLGLTTDQALAMMDAACALAAGTPQAIQNSHSLLAREDSAGDLADIERAVA